MIPFSRDSRLDGRDAGVVELHKGGEVRTGCEFMLSVVVSEQKQ